jgi:hypothetical protein
VTVAGMTLQNWQAGPGSAIMNDGTALVADCTPSGNFSWVSGGIANWGTMTLTNSIIADSSNGANCYGSITSLGHNIDSDGSCGLKAAGDLPQTAPCLDSCRTTAVARSPTPCWRAVRRLMQAATPAQRQISAACAAPGTATGMAWPGVISARSSWLGGSLFICRSCSGTTESRRHAQVLGTQAIPIAAAGIAWVPGTWMPDTSGYFW